MQSYLAPLALGTCSAIGRVLQVGITDHCQVPRVCNRAVQTEIDIVTGEERLSQKPSGDVADINTIGAAQDGRAVVSAIVENAPKVFGDLINYSLLAGLELRLGGERD